MKELGFAILGCGRIAVRHAELFKAKAIKNAKLVAVSDVQVDRAQNFSQKYNVPHYDDFKVMIAKHDHEIDAVLVLSESGKHAGNAIEVAKLYKNVVVEKPMALTLKDADHMIEACDRHGVKLFVIKQNRYNKPVQALRHAIDEAAFGKMVMGTVRVRWSRDQKYYDQDKWRGTWAMDGGVFSNQASHHIDLLQWCLGTPVSVYAKTRTALVDIECEDTGVAVIKFESGALGVIEATTATRPKDLEGSLSIMGEKGSVMIGGFAVNKIETWNFTDEFDFDIAAHNENPPDVYGFGHIAYLNNVVESLLFGKTSLVDGLEGRKSLELISAIYESAETGKEVAIRFQPTHTKLGR